MKIEYLHKGIDAINLPGLLRSKLVTNKAPVYFKNREPPIISYQYTDTVASKLFNLSSPRSCQCQMSKYCYQPHRHIIHRVPVPANKKPPCIRNRSQFSYKTMDEKIDYCSKTIGCTRKKWFLTCGNPL